RDFPVHSTLTGDHDFRCAPRGPAVRPRSDRHHTGAQPCQASTVQNSSPHAPKPLAELIDPGWADALAGVEADVHTMGEFLRAENAAGRGYFPPGEDVLRAFTYPFEQVRVLIV